MVYWIFVIAVPLHTVWLSVPPAEVKFNVGNAVTVTFPVRLTGVQPPVVVTVYVPPAVGDPEIVTTPPATLLVKPDGRPVTTAPVALPPKV
jgi:hypothetical protein